MAAPTFSGNPVWFKVPPSTSGDLLPDYANYNYPPGPFEFNKKFYWVVYEYVLEGSNQPYTIAAYRSSDRAKSQPLARIASGVTDVGAFYLNTYWDGSSRYAYLTFLTGQGVSTAIKTMVFDMLTESFSPINDPGVTVGNDFFDAYCVPKANGDLVLVWDLNSVPQMFGRLYSGGVWSGTVTLPAQQLLSVQPIGSKVGIFSTTPIVGDAGAATVFYSAFDGVTVSANISLAISNPLLSFGPWSTIYDPIHDTVSCAIAETYTPISGLILNQTIFSVSPADGSGGVIVRTVVDSDSFPLSTFWRELQYIGANADFSEFYMMVDQGKPDGAAPQLFIYTAPAITGPWSSQSVFYNQVLNNSTPPGLIISAPRPLIYAYSFRVLADGSIGFTAEFVFQTSGAPVSLVAGISGVPVPPIEVNIIFCGVVRFLIADRGPAAAAPASLGRALAGADPVGVRGAGGRSDVVSAALQPSAGAARPSGAEDSNVTTAFRYSAGGNGPIRVRVVCDGLDRSDRPRAEATGGCRGEFVQPVAHSVRQIKDITAFSPHVRVFITPAASQKPQNLGKCTAVSSAFVQPVARSARETNEISDFTPECGYALVGAK